MTLCTPEAVARQLADAGRLWLFLDYDGTLADFAPTPDIVRPDPEIAALLGCLKRHADIRVALISGRRLSHVEKLVPVPGILLAGTYGVELRTPEGERVHRVPYDRVRPVLEALKPRWQEIIAPHEGFYLEDKGWSLAIHARFAPEGVAERILSAARAMAAAAAAAGPFRVLGGHRFLEIGPVLANKGRTVDALLERYAWPGALPLYVGDDDKDEEAFAVIKARGGIALLVSPEPRETRADCRLETPQAARRWLAMLPQRLGQPDVSR